jgi:P27 family predicted phage terminase small subunit
LRLAFFGIALMSGSPKKLPIERQGHGAATTDVALREEKQPVPIPPKGLLRKTQLTWVSIWDSQVARAWDPVADIGLVERWIRAVDECERVMPEFKKHRVTEGSMKQLTLNPLGSYLAQLKTEIKACETELGLTPMARAKLGINLGQSKLTAMEVNRRLNQRDQGAAIDGEAREIDDEWEQA